MPIAHTRRTLGARLPASTRDVASAAASDVHQAILRLPGIQYYIDPEFPDLVPASFIEQNSGAALTSSGAMKPILSYATNSHPFLDFRGLSDGNLKLPAAGVPQTFSMIMVLVPYAATLAGADNAFLFSFYDTARRYSIYRQAGGTNVLFGDVTLGSGGLSPTVATLGLSALTRTILGVVHGPSTHKVFVDDPTTPVDSRGAVGGIVAYPNADLLIGGIESPGSGNGCDCLIGKVVICEGDISADARWALAFDALDDWYDATFPFP